LFPHSFAIIFLIKPILLAGDIMILVITGPSGTGKTTIKRILTEKFNIPRLMSATSREQRPGEVNGTDYLFVSKKEFEKMIEEGRLLEWVEYSGNYYGLKKNRNMEGVAVVEARGALRLKRMFHDKVRIIYLNTPEKIRKKRMLERGDSPEEVDERLRADRERFESSGVKEQADIIVENINLEETVNKILAYKEASS